MTDPEPRGDGAPSEEALWRSIVDNYGDRAELSADEVAELEQQRSAGRAEEDSPGHHLEWDDRFVAPVPPPLPKADPPVLLAWAGVLLAPLALMIVVIFSLPVATLIDALLVIWFLGGFAYLVSAMPNEPRDPWDDGAQV
ncbi:MAG: hypothetical protein U0R78_04800 [Nocardioidaceae bacterium]